MAYAPCSDDVILSPYGLPEPGCCYTYLIGESVTPFPLSWKFLQASDPVVGGLGWVDSSR